MRIAIVGAGGVGGYFGGMLAQGGNDVFMLARGPHLQEIRNNGLKIETPSGSVINPSLTAVADASESGTVDLVVVAVKGWQLGEAMPVIESFCDENTCILPLLNGVTAPARIQSELPHTKVLGGLCGIIAYIKQPGLIHHQGIDPFVTMGRLPAATDKTQPGVEPAILDSIKNAFESAAIDIRISKDIELSMWRKYLFICPLSAITSVTRSTIGSVRSTDESLQLLEQAIDETLAVGRAAGVALTQDHREDVLKKVFSNPGDGTTSMQRDIQGERRSELETQVGTVLKLGEKHAVKTPLMHFVYKSLKLQENRSEQRQ